MIKNIHLLFEQSGTFKNEFKKEKDINKSNNLSNVVNEKEVK